MERECQKKHSPIEEKKQEFEGRERRKGREEGRERERKKKGRCCRAVLPPLKTSP
jgi:hypothetical protein